MLAAHHSFLGFFWLIQTQFIFDIKLIQIQFIFNIKFVCSNNALELAFYDFFSLTKGAFKAFNYSCVDRSQQNFVVERKHKKNLNIARTSHFQSNMSLAYWR